MKTRTKSIPEQLKSQAETYVGDLSDIVFFDIETTGLSHKTAFLYLVGAAFMESGRFVLCQYLAEDLSEEEAVLKAFSERIHGKKRLIHFNGSTFDLPFLQARCRKYGLEPDFLDEVDSPEALSMMRKFLQEHKRPDGSLTFDGVFAHTDYHGYMFLNLLREEGYRVPEDVQIIGFDGIRRFGGENEPLFVSSICQPVRQLAAKCVELVLAEDRADVPSLTLLPVRYEYGGTTKKEQEK